MTRRALRALAACAVWIALASTGSAQTTTQALKFTGWKASVASFFTGCSLTYFIDGDKDELSRERIEADLLACGGAHKPSEYRFGFYDPAEEESDRAAQQSAAASASGCSASRRVLKGLRLCRRCSASAWTPCTARKC